MPPQNKKPDLTATLKALAKPKPAPKPLPAPKGMTIEQTVKAQEQKMRGPAPKPAQKPDLVREARRLQAEGKAAAPLEVRAAYSLGGAFEAAKKQVPASLHDLLKSHLYMAASGFDPIRTPYLQLMPMDVREVAERVRRNPAAALRELQEFRAARSAPGRAARPAPGPYTGPTVQAGERLSDEDRAFQEYLRESNAGPGRFRRELDQASAAIARGIEPFAAIAPLAGALEMAGVPNVRETMAGLYTEGALTPARFLSELGLLVDPDPRIPANVRGWAAANTALELSPVGLVGDVRDVLRGLARAGGRAAAEAGAGAAGETAVRAARPPRVIDPPTVDMGSPDLAPTFRPRPQAAPPVDPIEQARARLRAIDLPPAEAAAEPLRFDSQAFRSRLTAQEQPLKIGQGKISTKNLQTTQAALMQARAELRQHQDKILKADPAYGYEPVPDYVAQRRNSQAGYQYKRGVKTKDKQKMLELIDRTAKLERKIENISSDIRTQRDAAENARFGFEPGSDGFITLEDGTVIEGTIGGWRRSLNGEPEQIRFYTIDRDFIISPNEAWRISSTPPPGVTSFNQNTFTRRLTAQEQPLEIGQGIVDRSGLPSRFDAEAFAARLEREGAEPLGMEPGVIDRAGLRQAEEAGQAPASQISTPIEGAGARAEAPAPARAVEPERAPVRPVEQAKPKTTLDAILDAKKKAKQDHPGVLIGFRVGDFYGFYEQDAIDVAKMLDITLVEITASDGTRVELAGIPFHRAEKYVSRLSKSGRRTALIEDFKKANSIYSAIPVEAVPTPTPEPAAKPPTTEGAVKPARPARKEPWEMTRGEYMKAPDDVQLAPRDITLDEWRAINGRRLVLDEHGGLRYPHGISKAERRRMDQRLAKKSADLDASAKEYAQLKAEGLLPQVTQSRTLKGAAGDLESNQAFFRAHHKRQVRKAIAEGKPVPPEVLADYPEIAAKAGKAPTSRADLPASARAPEPAAKPSTTEGAVKPAKAIGFGKGQSPPVTMQEMRIHAANLRKRADDMERRAMGNITPSGAITGASGRDRSGLNKRWDKTFGAAMNTHKEAEALRESASKWEQRANRIDPEKLAEKARRKEVQEQARQAVKQKESAARKAAPIVNRPTGRPITAAEWKKASNDYKEIRVVEDGKYRVREIMHGGPKGLTVSEVYLTDKPIKLPPGSAPEPPPAKPAAKASEQAMAEAQAKKAALAKRMKSSKAPRGGKKGGYVRIPDPEAVRLVTEIAQLYLKAGVLKVQEIIDDIIQSLPNGRGYARHIEEIVRGEAVKMGDPKQAAAKAAPPAPATTPAAPVAPPKIREIGLRHEDTAKLRETFNLPQYSRQGRTIDEAVGRAKRSGLTGEAADTLARTVAAEPRPLTDVEQVALLMRSQEVVEEVDKLSDEVARAIDAGSPRVPELSARLDERRSLLESLVLASDRAGSDWGRAGRIRQMLIRRDYSGESLLRRGVAAAKKSSPDIERTAKQYASTIQAMQKRVDALELKLAEAQAKQVVAEARPRRRPARSGGGIVTRTVSRADYEKALKVWQSGGVKGPKTRGAVLRWTPEQAEALKTLARYHFESGVDTVAGLSAKLKADAEGMGDLEVFIAIREALSKKAAVLNRGRSYGEDFLQSGHWGLQSPEVRKARVRLRQMQRESDAWVDKLQSDREWQEASLAKKAGKVTLDVLSLPRALLASSDLSAMGRQGLLLGLSNPKAAAKATRRQLIALKSPAAFDRVAAEIAENPYYDLAVSSRLGLSGAGDAPLLPKEEDFISNLASKIPVVSHTERAYVAYLNSLRMDAFASMVRALEGGGKMATREEAEDIARYVNVMTGRGDVAPGAWSPDMTKVLNSVFFAPRFALSRFQALALEPVRKARSRRALAAIGKEYGKVLGSLSTIYGLASLAGAEVEMDPRSSRFGQIKLGDVAYDLTGGLRTYLVFLARMGASLDREESGKLKTPTVKTVDGQMRKTDPMYLASRFGINKLAPIPKAAYTAATRDTYSDEPPTVLSQAKELVVPINIKTAMETYSKAQDAGKDPWKIVGAQALGDFFGASGSYDD